MEVVSLLDTSNGGVRATFLRYGGAVGLALLALLLRLLLAPLIGYQENPFLVFFSAVAISALVGGLRAGLVTLALAGLFIAVFFLPLFDSLPAAPLRDGVRLGVFLIEGLIVTLIGKALRTAWRQAEIARAELAQAVQVRDQFLAVASHDLKTPLTALLGQTQALQRRAAVQNTLSERDQRALQTINEQAKRLHSLIEALLDISRIQAGRLSIQREPMDVCTLVRRIVQEVEPTLDLHTIHLAGVEEALIIAGDELRLEQVFQNLLHNAIKYSPSGGLITVQIERQAGRACVTVRDQGIGIPEEARARLFQQFYRAGNVEGQHITGLGIGLYIVKEVVTLHGGDVAVESREGAGSTFSVYLPLYTPDASLQRVDPAIVENGASV
jgi:signal transduction histidine kinase